MANFLLFGVQVFVRVALFPGHASGQSLACIAKPLWQSTWWMAALAVLICLEGHVGLAEIPHPCISGRGKYAWNTFLGASPELRKPAQNEERLPVLQIQLKTDCIPDCLIVWYHRLATKAAPSAVA